MKYTEKERDRIVRAAEKYVTAATDEIDAVNSDQTAEACKAEARMRSASVELVTAVRQAQIRALVGSRPAPKKGARRV